MFILKTLSLILFEVLENCGKKNLSKVQRPLSYKKYNLILFQFLLHIVDIWHLQLSKNLFRKIGRKYGG